MWLIDLASQIPESAQLDGYDLSEEQFPLSLLGLLMPPSASLMLLGMYQRASSINMMSSIYDSGAAS